MRRLPLLVSLAVLAAASAARAQTTTVTQNAALVSISHADGSLSTTTVNGQWYVNRRDCGLDVFDAATDTPDNVDIVINTSRIGVTEFGGNPSIWIGSGCENSSSRNNTSTSTCIQAIGNTTTSPIYKNGTSYTISLSSLRPIPSTPNSTNFDLCLATRNMPAVIYIIPESMVSATTASVYAELSIYGDMMSPVAPTVTTSSPQGDNSVTVSYSTGSSTEVLGETHYFAIPGSCSSGGGDGGVGDGGTDAGVDGGTAVTDGGVGLVGTSLTTGQLPPLTLAGVYRGSAGTGGTATVRNSSIGLTAAGQTATFGMSMRDAAGNYSVVSNTVCVQRITTYGLCAVYGAGGGSCPRGGCSVGTTSTEGISFGALGLSLLTLGWLVIRRGGRS